MRALSLIFIATSTIAGLAAEAQMKTTPKAVPQALTSAAADKIDKISCADLLKKSAPTPEGIMSMVAEILKAERIDLELPAQFSDRGYYHNSTVPNYPISPDGRMVLVKYGKRGIVAVDLHKKRAKLLLTRIPGTFDKMQWSTDSKRALMRGSAARLLDFTDFLENGGSLKASVPMNHNIQNSSSPDFMIQNTINLYVRTMSLSPDGNSVFTRTSQFHDGRGALWTFPRGSVVPSQVVATGLESKQSHGFNTLAQAFTPDSRYIVVAGSHEVSPASEESLLRLYVFDAATGKIVLEHDHGKLEGTVVDHRRESQRQWERHIHGSSSIQAQLLQYERVDSVSAVHTSGNLTVTVKTYTERFAGKAATGDMLMDRLDATNDLEHRLDLQIPGAK